ncbi:4'-phosphopantetheinyl transferase family protein [Paraburkholderia hayleyella]|uniref:4'-phosphopantetheinyl transferase family protein n=1 Tax=Paraburkholderia hayleyella TaxID=2152889 RepID=UPI001FE4749C|nr:4'-phosphopantetheinyl transferase superfamily protein [Paraburkholderia hayleyella]
MPAVVPLSVPLRLVSVTHAGPPEVALWQVALRSEDEGAFDVVPDAACLALLSADERRQAQAFQRHEDVLRFVTVRAALRVLLGHALNRAPHTLALTRDAHGRPQLAGAAPGGLDFNVSHAGAYGLIALSTAASVASAASGYRVGVDLEVCRSAFDWRSVAALTLDHEEQAELAALESAAAQRAAFFESWVAKEALLKAAGVGITEGLNIAPLYPRRGEQERVEWRAATQARWPGFAACWVAAPEGYCACLAWSARGA